MWSRVVEIMLGVWLAMSPFIFQHAADNPVQWWNDFACSLIIITLALLSFYHPLRFAHLLSIVVGLWLIGFAYLMAESPVAPALQNNVMVGLLLGMFAIIPNDADLPSESWREFELGKEQQETIRGREEYREKLGER